MSVKKTVFLTGATGSMGSAGLRELCKNSDKYNLVLLARPSAKNREMLQPYAELVNVKIVWGDLNNYEDIKACVQNADIILHVAAFVSPEADYFPELAMQINYGSTCKIIKAIKEYQTIKPIKLVYIGTIAETGDRMPPIHWGRVGDPIKPSIHDYYAVSKVAAERAVIESGLEYWVSLRQTGIFAKHMCEIQDGIIFHNCLNNVLEYVSDDDSGVLLSHVCEDLPEEFWGHIYNIGGGKATRLSAYQLYSTMFGMLGITKLEDALEANWFATRNFHGQFYLDSDKLEDFLHFRSHDAKYLWDIYQDLNKRTLRMAKIITRLPGGAKLIGNGIKKNFKNIAKTDHGTLSWLEHNNLEFIEPFFISREQQELIPLMKDFKPYVNYQAVIHIEHGYDENKPLQELCLADMKKAASFRGGKCLAKEMVTGDWSQKLSFSCAFGHSFLASPKLILEGGHWCPVCERTSWNYHEVAKRSEFFAGVWYPLHSTNEPSKEYPKIVNELAYS